MTRLAALCALLASASALTGCASNNDAPLNLVRVIDQSGRFTILRTALRVTGFDTTLRQPGPYTLLAPTDDAFRKLPANALQALLDNPSELTRVLRFHVIPARLTTDQLRSLTTIGTLFGQPLALAVDDGRLVINPPSDAARILTPNIAASNGIIHAINTVLVPPLTNLTVIDALRDDPNFTTLVSALRNPAVAVVLQQTTPLTFFAPTDEAFRQLPAGTVESLFANPAQLIRILQFHIVPGSFTAADLAGVRTLDTLLGPNFAITPGPRGTFVLTSSVSRARVVRTDIRFNEGVIHAVDRILIAPATP